MKRLIVCGSNGRMGALVCQLAKEEGEWEITGEVNTKRPLDSQIDRGDVIVDFSLPQGAVQHAALAEKHQKPIVIGTTGLDIDQEKKIEEASRSTPILYAPNMSVGINVLLKLIETAAKSLGPQYEIVISEIHHLHKKDCPSGTAKAMGKAVQKITGNKPKIESIREGEVIGEHSIVFGSPWEHLAMYHRALDRKVFAKGALLAAKWILDKKPGLYSMAEVLGIAS